MKKPLVRILAAALALALSTVNILAMDSGAADGETTADAAVSSPFVPDVPEPARLPASPSSPFIPDLPEPVHFEASPESPFIPDLPEPVYPIASPQSPFIPELPESAPFFPIFL